MVTRISKSVEETLELGRGWGGEAERGWVIALSGDLGAGKTHLVKGIAQGLGITTRVHSPTFSLINQYRGGRLPLYHLDLYRLNSAAEVIGAGLDLYLCEPDGVAVVEWAERWFVFDSDGATVASSCRRLRRVQMDTLSESERKIAYEDFGS